MYVYGRRKSLYFYFCIAKDKDILLIIRLYFAMFISPGTIIPFSSLIPENRFSLFPSVSDRYCLIECFTIPTAHMVSNNIYGKLIIILVYSTCCPLTVF